MDLLPNFNCSDLDVEIAPCGACRQFIAEFGLDWSIILIKNRNEHRVFSVREILPMAFDMSMLELHKKLKSDTLNNSD